MRYPLTLLGSLALTLSLIGCEEPEPVPPQEPEEPPEVQVAPDERTDPADEPPAEVTPEREPDPEPEPAVQPRTEHDDLLADDDRDVRWWDDDELAEKLQLEPEQRTRLLEARRALHDARLQGREQLDEQRDLQRQAEGDRDRLAELREQSGLIQQELEDAELRWEDTVRTTLRPDQLQLLEELTEE